jgi:hypothetical protein
LPRFPDNTQITLLTKAPARPAEIENVFILN